MKSTTLQFDDIELFKNQIRSGGTYGDSIGLGELD